MKQIGIILLLGGSLLGMDIHAQTKVSVIEYNEAKAKIEAKAIFDRDEESLSKEGYGGWALFWELSKRVLEQYTEQNKKEMDNPEVLNEQIRALTDTIGTLRKEILQVKLLSTQVTDGKNQLLKLQIECDSLQKKVAGFAATERRLPILEAEIVRLKQQKTQSDSTLKAISAERQELMNDIKQLGEVKKMVESKMGNFNKVFSSAESDMLSVSQSEIQDALDKVSVFLKELPEIVQKQAGKLKNIYFLIDPLQKAVVAMKQPYDGAEINKLIGEIEANRKWAWSEEQKKTTLQISSSLKQFEICTKGFESVIDNVIATLEVMKWDAPERNIQTMLQEIDYKVCDKNPQAAEKGGDYGNSFEFLNKQLSDLRCRIEKGDKAPNVPKKELEELRRSVRKVK